ncbi:unnamed protein product [Pleuronectes platessa]|uniref:Uncharacterized protein n=1 Tax=Pleuronectes platessa TaxID=8262 RepID=A0A9N7W1H6_PLEPL|nr:unnamed protein product [Pleuronectes platessa]
MSRVLRCHSRAAGNDTGTALSGGGLTAWTLFRGRKRFEDKNSREWFGHRDGEDGEQPGVLTVKLCSVQTLHGFLSGSCEVNGGERGVVTNSKRRQIGQSAETPRRTRPIHTRWRVTVPIEDACAPLHYECSSSLTEQIKPS